MSDQPADPRPQSVDALLDELARAQVARVARDARELEADIWDTDEDLNDFLADLKASRQSSLS